MEGLGSHSLILVFDCNPLGWNGANEMLDYLRSTVHLLNVYLAQKQSNHSLLLLSNQHMSVVGFEARHRSDVCLENVLGRLQEFAHIPDSDIDRSGLSRSILQALCVLNKQKRPNENLRVSGRILLVTPASDYPEHYISLMNAAFTAQKLVHFISIQVLN